MPNYVPYEVTQVTSNQGPENEGLAFTMASSALIVQGCDIPAGRQRRK